MCLVLIPTSSIFFHENITDNGADFPVYGRPFSKLSSLKTFNIDFSLLCATCCLSTQWLLYTSYFPEGCECSNCGMFCDKLFMRRVGKMVLVT